MQGSTFMSIFSTEITINRTVPVQIEVILIPGLPQIQILGGASGILKELPVKLRSIFKSHQIPWPKGKSILVNLVGGLEIYKCAQLELGIALAILFKIYNFKDDLNVWGVGQISLEGTIISERPHYYSSFLKNDMIVAAIDSKDYEHLQIRELFTFSDLVINIQELKMISQWTTRLSRQKLKVEINEKVSSFSDLILKPNISFDPFHTYFSEEEVALLKIVSLGRHSILLAGPKGQGKSTLAEAFYYLTEKPDSECYFHQMRYFQRQVTNFWRPFVNPHHSISALALLGGGNQCLPGQITRAHGGVLLLDEFLEFDPKCQEALREPIQNKIVHLARGSKHYSYPCDFQLIATTNLCPCGDWTPGSDMGCGYSFQRCHRTRDKLSGPMLDRFDILYFVNRNRNRNKQRMHSLESIRLDIDRIRSQFKKPEYSDDVLLKQLETLIPDGHSRRRQIATMNVAVSIARMNGETNIGMNGLLNALKYSFKSFTELYFAK